MGRAQCILQKYFAWGGGGITLEQCLGVEATTEFEPWDILTTAHAAQQLQCCQHLCNPMPAVMKEITYLLTRFLLLNQLQLIVDNND